MIAHGATIAAALQSGDVISCTSAALPASHILSALVVAASTTGTLTTLSLLVWVPTLGEVGWRTLTVSGAQPVSLLADHLTWSAES